MTKSLKKLLNYNYVSITNKTHKIGKYDLPYVNCTVNVVPDYFALYSEEQDYNRTEKTCVCFFQNDIKFDGIFGLWNAIYYDEKELLDYYKKRFSNVKFVVALDYSLAEDIENFENYYRIAKSRIVSVWFTLELGIIVYPLLTFSKREDFAYMLNGMENVSVLCVSLKGSMENIKKKKLMIEAINYATDNLKSLKTIIVYSDSIVPNHNEEFFVYPKNHGIKIIYPENSLHLRNLKNRKCDNG